MIRIIPVSVCHHVSTIGQRSPPMCSWYQTHASGLIGSPTDRAGGATRGRASPRTPAPTSCARGSRSGRCRGSSTWSARRSPTSWSLSGKSGVPSYITVGRPVAERPVDDVAVPGDPADVRRAPEHRIVLHVEHAAVGLAGADEVARSRVRDALRLRRSSPTCRGRAEILRVPGSHWRSDSSSRRRATRRRVRPPSGPSPPARRRTRTLRTFERRPMPSSAVASAGRRCPGAMPRPA